MAYFHHKVFAAVLETMYGTCVAIPTASLNDWEAMPDDIRMALRVVPAERRERKLLAA
jgi:hypothetical protein